MIVKTKKYKLESSTYIKLALISVLKQQWWVSLIVLAICSGYFWIENIWWFIGAGIGVILYILFWLIQFAGVTQLDQTKMLFDKLAYEITSQQVLIKLNNRQGMPLKWEQIKRGAVGKDYLLLIVNKAQLIHLPFRVFNSDNERKFVESIMKRKGLVR